MAFDFDKAMPYASNGLYGDLRRDAAEAWSAYVDHRFVRELAAGVLPKAEFLAWMVQDYLYLIHYTRAYALLIYKSGSLPMMRRAAGIVFGLLNTEMSLHREQLTADGVLEADLEQAQETIETLAYGRYILDRAHSGDVLDLMVTLSACLAGYGEIGMRLLEDPATVLDGNPYRPWIETYGGEDYQEIMRSGLGSLQDLAEAYGASARYPMLLEEFRQAVRLEALFWDAGRSALAMEKARG